MVRERQSGRSLAFLGACGPSSRRTQACRATARVSFLIHGPHATRRVSTRSFDTRSKPSIDLVASAIKSRAAESRCFGEWVFSADFSFVIKGTNQGGRCPSWTPLILRMALLSFLRRRERPRNGKKKKKRGHDDDSRRIAPSPARRARERPARRPLLSYKYNK